MKPRRSTTAGRTFTAEGAQEVEVTLVRDSRGVRILSIVVGDHLYGRCEIRSILSGSMVDEFIERLGWLSPFDRGKLRAEIENVARREGIWAATYVAKASQEAASFPPLSDLVQRLIARATAQLDVDPDVRARYAVDWETDALWTDGRWRRMAFAVTLRFITVPRLRRVIARERDIPRRA